MMNMISTRTASVLVGLALLASCATPTPYQAMDGRYGYDESRIEGNRYLVSFNGNSSTPRETVEGYLLFRAAELTLENGFDYFVAVEQDIESTSTFRTTSPPVCGYYRYGFYRFPYYAYGYPWGYASTTRETKRYEAIAFIVLFKGEKPADDPNAYDARDVLKNLSPSIIRPAA